MPTHPLSCWSRCPVHRRTADDGVLSAGTLWSVAADPVHPCEPLPGSGDPIAAARSNRSAPADVGGPVAGVGAGSGLAQ